jgi:hypothetical protein
MITCQEAARLMSESLDQKLPLRQRMALRMHLLMCKLCPRFWCQLLFLRNATGRFVKEPDRDVPFPSESLSMDARERIERAVVAGLKSSD